MITKIRSPFTNLDFNLLNKNLDELWQVMFYNFPSESKPPLVIDVYGDEPTDSDVISNLGVQIQMAVAGYKPDQISVYGENNCLVVEGDNTDADNIPAKFQSRFKRLFPCKENVDLDNTTVDLTNGILTVRVPFHQAKEKPVKTFF